MPEQPDADNKTDGSADPSIDPLIKAYVDEQIQQSKIPDSDSRKKKWKNSWRSASPITKGTFILTVGIAFATIAYAIIALIQLPAIEESASAAVKSAYAACQAAQISRQALIDSRDSSYDTRRVADASILQAIAVAQSSRALIESSTVGHEQITVARFVPIVVPYGIKNSGKSSAIGVSLRVRLVWVARNSDPDFTYPEKLTAGALYPIMNPGRDTEDSAVEKHMSVPLLNADGSLRELTDQEFSDYRNEKGDLILYGRIDYRDDFGPTDRTFCEVFSNHPTGLTKNIGHKKCADYNRQEKSSPMTQYPPPPVTDTPPAPIACVPPK